jgi:hypothetical protein
VQSQEVIKHVRSLEMLKCTCGRDSNDAKFGVVGSA